jgi:glycerol-3-phosphate dehydrogenase subunit B
MPPRSPYDVVVVGLGLGGLVAGLVAARRGARTLVVGRGQGGLRQRPGTVDVLGYHRGLVASPERELASFVAEHPDHPYALAGAALAEALELVREAGAGEGLELVGDLAQNRLVATAAGTLRPSCLVPWTMEASWPGARVLVAGLSGFRDLWPELCAAQLPVSAAHLDLHLEARAVGVEEPSPSPRHLDGLALARCFDRADFRERVAAALRSHLGDATLVALPAALGMGDPRPVLDLQARLERKVIELPSLPPSVPGLRLERALMGALRRAGGRTLVGPAARVVVERGEVRRVELASSGHPTLVPVGRVVLATGGLRGGGLWLERDGRVQETTAGLPAVAPRGEPGHSFFELARWLAPIGVRVDQRMRPLDESGRVAVDGLHCCGGLLAGADRAGEKSADGVACATALVAAREATA